MKRSIALLVALLLFFALTSVVGAQETTAVSDDEVNDVAGELFCPVCENTPLDVCPTQACKDWRELIRTQLAEGQSKEEIKAYFALQYGDRVLAEPPQEGFDLIVWLLPVAAVAVGGVFFYRFLHNLRGGQAQRPAATSEPAPEERTNGRTSPAPDDYVARIEEEVRKS